MYSLGQDGQLHQRHQMSPPSAAHAPHSIYQHNLRQEDGWIQNNLNHSEDHHSDYHPTHALLQSVVYSGETTVAFKQEVPDEEEEVDEPVSALDLRIGKAAESITLFDNQNVLGSLSSSAGLTVPRAGLSRLASTSSAPYTLTRRSPTSPSEPSTSSTSVSAHLASSHHSKHSTSSPYVRTMESRKRLFEPSPDSPHASTDVAASWEPLRRIGGLVPPHLLTDEQSVSRTIPEESLMHRAPSPGPHRASSGPSSATYGGGSGHYLSALHRLSGDRHLERGGHHPEEFSRRRQPETVTSAVTSFHHPFESPDRDDEHHHRSYLRSPGLGAGGQHLSFDDMYIKAEVMSPSQMMSSSSPPPLLHHHQHHFEFSRRHPSEEDYPSTSGGGTTSGDNSLEYKSSYLHHILRRQSHRQQHQQQRQQHHPHPRDYVDEDEPMSEIDRRLRLTEQESRLHDEHEEVGGGHPPSRMTVRPPTFHTRPSAEVSSSFRRQPPLPQQPPPSTPLEHPVRASSTLPLNLSKQRRATLRDDAAAGSGSTSRIRDFLSAESDVLRHHEDFKQDLPEVNSPESPLEAPVPSTTTSAEGVGKGKRGRPRKHAPKIPLPPLYVFIRNMLHNRSYNPRIVSWVNESVGIFKVNNTLEFARTWGKMKSNRSEEMNYEKMSRAMRYHYGSPSRKGHLAMVKEKRLVYRFGELAIRWRPGEVILRNCTIHDLCKGQLCLWTKE